MIENEFSLVSEANSGWLFSCSRPGARHRREGAPSQDASATWSSNMVWGSYLALAIADGHGDERHDLSHFGAAIAVQTALDQVRDFFYHFKLGEEGSSSLFKRNFRVDFPRRLGNEWRKGVLQDARIRFGDKLPAVVPSHDTLFSRYGTTLLTAVITSDEILLAQIGDGDILFVGEDDQIMRPFKQDEIGVITETHSLASPNTFQHWQTAVFERATGGMLFMATDGLSNAVADGELASVALRLRNWIQEYGFDRVSVALPEWLDRFSEEGSGDDVTLGIAWVMPRLD